MNFGRIIYDIKRQVAFEDGITQSIRTEVTENLIFLILDLRSFDNYFWGICSLFIYGRGEIK